MPRRTKGKKTKPPRKRASPKEHARHVQYATQRLMVCFFPSDVTKALCRKFGLEERQAQRVLVEAKEQIRQLVEDVSGTNQLPAALAVYLWIIQQGSRQGKLAAMTTARTRMDRLLGLDKVDTGDVSSEQVQRLYDELKKPPPEEIEDESEGKA